MANKVNKIILIEKKLEKQLFKLKKEDFDLFAKVMAAILSLETYRFEDNILVTKQLEKNIYELKIDQHNKYIRVFYSEYTQEIRCWEMLEKKTNKIPKDILKRLRSKI